MSGTHSVRLNLIRWREEEGKPTAPIRNKRTTKAVGDEKETLCESI